MPAISKHAVDTKKSALEGNGKTEGNLVSRMRKN